MGLCFTVFVMPTVIVMALVLLDRWVHGKWPVVTKPHARRIEE